MRMLEVVALSVGVVVVWRPSIAAACSPPQDAGVCMAITPIAFPAGETTDVPLNTEVLVTWLFPAFLDSTPAPSTTFRLVTEAGVEVALERSPTSDRWRPTAELAPYTVYVLEDQLEREPTDAGVGCGPTGSFVEVARFVTGGARDESPPALPGAPVIDDCCNYTRCTSGACCGFWTAAARRATWTVDADTSVLAYRVRDTTVFGPPSGVVGWAETGMFGYRHVTPTIPAGSVEVRAIDGAGNASDWAPPFVIADCDRSSSPPTSDWSVSWEDSCTSGAPGPVDAGVMDASIEARHSRACAAGYGGSPVALALWLASIGALARRRRRPD